MPSSPRDNNFVPAIFGVSSVDNETPTPVKVNPATGAMLIDGSSLGDIGITPATKTVATTTSGYKADYYTDGSTDETEINEAITATYNAGGGIVLIKAGNYMLTSNSITMLSNVTLKGEGIATYITMADGSNIHGIVITAQNNVTIRDLYFDGNGINQTIEVHGIRIGSSSNYINIINCKIINSSHHNINSVLSTPLNSYIRVIDCDLSGAGSLIEANPDGAEVAMRASYGQVRGCNITSNSFCGIEIYANGDHCSAIQNFIIWNGESDSLGAIEIGTSHENAIVSGNIITGTGVSGQAAIKVSGTNYCVITENTIFDLTNGQGIWITNSTNNVISNNTIKNLSAEGIYIEGTYNTFIGNIITKCLTGIYVRPTAFYNAITGNIISSCSQNGILVNISAKDNTFTGNQCVNNSQSSINTYDGINSQGQNCIFIGNHCYDNQGSQTQRYGIRMSSASNNIISGNNLRSNISGQLSILGGSNNEVGHNKTS